MEQAKKKAETFASNLKGISTNIDKAYSGLGDLLSPAVDGFKAVESVGKKAGNAISTGLKGFAAASTAVAGFGAAAVNSGMQFDATMSEVSAISGAAGADFDALRDKALEMGAKTKFSASEAGEAMTYMAMAGWKAGDMIGGIEGIMNLAAASGEDLATTSDIVTDALTAFGLQASDSGHFADILAVASSNANTNVGMMGDTFKYVAPIAGAMGYSAEDTAVAIGLMANSGIKATQAGTSLRSIMTRLAKPTKESQTAMDALGLSITNSDGSMKSLNEIIGDMRAGFSGLTESQKASYAAMLGGQEAMSGLLAIVNASESDVQKLTAAIGDCNGAASEMAAIMVDNLQGDLTLLGSAFESLQIAISDSLTPTLREFAQFGQKAMANLLEGFQGSSVSGFMSALSSIVTDGVIILAEKAPEFASVSMQFVGALGQGLIDAAPQVLTAAREVIGVLLTGFTEFLGGHSDEMVEIGSQIIEMVASGFTQAGEIISQYIGEFVPLIAQAFLSYHESLFTIGIDILGAIGQGVIENQGEIQGMASETIANMVTALRDNAPAIIEGGIALLEALVGAIMENMPLILETGAEIIGQLVLGISTSMPTLIAAVALILPQIAKIIDVVSSIGGAVSGVVNLVSGGITTILGIGSKLMGGIQALFALIMAHPVVAVVTAIIAAVVLLWNNCEAFRDAVQGIMEAIKGFFVGAWKAIQGAWEGAKEFFSGVVDGIKGVFDGIGEFLGGLFTAAWELVQSAWNTAVAFFTEIGNGIQSVFEAVTDFLGSAFSAAWDIVSAVWGVAVSFFSTIWDGISSAGSAAAEAVSGVFSTAWDAITSVWDGALDFFGGIWSGIKDTFSGALDSFKTIGSNMLEGLWNGISDKIAWLKSKVSGVVDTIKGWFTGKDGFDEHSPSKWSAQVFRYVMEGGVQGLDEGTNRMMREVNSITDQIKNGLNFGTATVGLRTSRVNGTTYGTQSGLQVPVNQGGDTFNFYSPKALDPVSAAREMRKAKQQMALAYG